MYDTVHDSRYVTTILKELDVADQNHNMRDAPAHNDIGPHSLANAVDLNVSYLNVLVNAETNDDTTTYGNAYATTSDSKSSVEKLHHHGRPKEKKKEKFTEC